MSLSALRFRLSRANEFVLEKLARVTSSGAYVPQVDGLRLLAIESVIAYHVFLYVPHAPARGLNGLADALFSKGWFGVELFFVISGFILSLPFASAYLKGTRMPSVGRYFVRRLTRLEPPYIVSLLVGLALMTALHGKSLAGLLPSLAASLTYSHVFVFGKTSLINGVLWSLEVEAQFYLLAPVLCRLFSIQDAKTRRLAIVTVALLAAPIAALPTLPFATGSHAWLVAHALGRVLILSYIGYFLAGLMLADLYLTNWASKSTGSRRWDLLTLAAFAILALMLGKRPDVGLRAAFDAAVYPALILAAYLGVCRGRFWNRLFGWRWAAVLGGMCYTVYMYHQFLILELRAHVAGMTASLPILFIGFSVLIYSLCAFLFVACEKPFMYKDWPARLRHALNSRFRRRPQPSPDGTLYAAE